MVDIVIVNWNSGAYLKKCIDSIFIEQNKAFIDRVILIDNNSIDNSIQSISPNNKIEWVINTSNLGFSKACNQGFRLCNAPFVLLLNPDTVLFENTIKDCIGFMQVNNSIDILGCRLLNDEGYTTPTCSRFPTALHIFFDATGFSKIAPAVFTPATIMTDWKHDGSRYVDQVMGAFMFMKKNIFEKNGYFDERFFVYYEEVDFSKRVASCGGKTFYNHSISAIHSGEGTTQSVKGFRLFLNLQSRLLYARKNFTDLGYTLVWFSTFFIEPVSRIIFLLLKARWHELPELFKGYKLLVKNK